MNQNAPAIRVKSASFAYGRQPVLEDVSIDIYPQDFLGVIGPNGGGKTTLAKIILGLLDPDSGSVEVFGCSPSVASSRIGYVPQHAHFASDFPVTVRDLVLTGRQSAAGLGRRYSADDKAAADDAIEQMGLAELARRVVGGLSGGERQRALVARALATRPDALILDEPTASVDSHVEQRFYELLQSLHQRIPIILVSHDLGFISTYVTRVACINRRLVVNPVGEMHAHDMSALYNEPVRMWSHDCKL